MTTDVLPSSNAIRAYLKDVAGLEGDSGLLARDEIVLHGIVLELRLHVYLTRTIPAFTLRRITNSFSTELQMANDMEHQMACGREHGSEQVNPQEINF